MIRLFDIVFSLALVLVLTPLMGILAIIIKWKAGSPVLFTQLRTGEYGKPFVLYKFSTMNQARNTAGQLLPDNQRLSPLGQWMRQYSLDELPQLWNVLKGDLSLVGPRPLLLEYINYYNPAQAKRLWVRPGITGLAQVNGRNGISWNEKFAFDTQYVEKRNYINYFAILLKTLLKVYKPDPIQQSITVTMEKFKGNPS